MYPPPRALSLTSLCYALLLPFLLSSVILTLLRASVAQPLLSAVSFVLNRIVCFCFILFFCAQSFHHCTALASRAFSYTLVSDAPLRRPVSCISCIYSILKHTTKHDTLTIRINLHWPLFERRVVHLSLKIFQSRIPLLDWTSHRPNDCKRRYC